MPVCQRRQGQGGKFAGLGGGVQREKVTAPGGTCAQELADHAAFPCGSLESSQRRTSSALKAVIFEDNLTGAGKVFFLTMRHKVAAENGKMLGIS
jgi:hypothetical protein